MQNQSDFKILSLSGGGYRGLYTAEVLKELENYLKDKSKNKEETDTVSLADMMKDVIEME